MKIKIATIAVLTLTIMSCTSGKSSTDSSLNTDKNHMTMTSIENIKWVISTLGGQGVSHKEKNGQSIHFMLDSENNRITGFSGCNTFIGTYKLEKGNRISFSQMASTRMACPNADFDEQQF